ncbi:hypothetical protein JS562_51295, partial [Agrobacterium sp. S2]|nr:hypothetical protein [Agrobacterium sp. S2]
MPMNTPSVLLTSLMGEEMMPRFDQGSIDKPLIAEKHHPAIGAHHAADEQRRDRHHKKGSYARPAKHDAGKARLDRRKTSVASVINALSQSELNTSPQLKLS